MTHYSTRDELEALALEACKPSLYYELTDTIDQCSDDDLVNIINGIYPEQPDNRDDDSAKYEAILDDDLSDYDDAMALDKQIWRNNQNELNSDK